MAKLFDKWSIAYHRILVGKEENRPCDCEQCREYMASVGLDTNGNELRREAMQESQ